MTEESEFELTKEDFISLDLQAVIDGIERKDCHYYSSAFYKKSNEITDAKVKEIFLILAFLMTSQLRLDSSENPFANIDRFNDKHLKFFSEIINLVTDDEIKSRIADVLWLRNKDHKMAEIAVFAYLNSAETLEDFEHWEQTQGRIERALQLASILGKKREPYQKVLERIYDLLDRCNGEDPLYLSSELMRLLQERREGDAKKYSSICEKLALNAELQNDYEKARKYWTRKATWHYQDKDEPSAREARLKIAETYEKESEFYFQTRQPRYSMASHPLERAIITYQNLGGLSEKVEEIKLKLREYQKKAVTELLPIPGEDINITDLVITAEKAVTEKSFIEALKSIATLSSPNNASYIRKQVEENREKYIFKTLFPNKLFGSGGRIIAVQPSEGEEAILSDMFEYARYSHQISVQGFINPARRIISLEHSARDFEFYDLLLNHPLIPEGREFIIARGLHAGLYGDFLTANHFLIPQIEESVRYVLLQCKIVPASFDEKGVQDEFNLNKLLTHTKFTRKLNEIFGEDLIFDLRCLLVERFGWNLRNDMAHGLLDHDNFYSYGAIYFWWLALRFYLLPYIFKREQLSDSENETTKE